MACSIDLAPRSGGLFLKARGGAHPPSFSLLAQRRLQGAESGSTPLPFPVFEKNSLLTFAAPKVSKSVVLQQAGPGGAGTALRDSHPAALMSRSLRSLRHSLSPAGCCVARRLEVAGGQ